MTYAKKLHDPRFQQISLTIMERDNWTCKLCGSIKPPMIVTSYVRKLNYSPWDYSDESLVTLCQHCHDYLERIGSLIDDTESEAICEEKRIVLSCVAIALRQPNSPLLHPLETFLRNHGYPLSQIKEVP